MDFRVWIENQLKMIAPDFKPVYAVIQKMEAMSSRNPIDPHSFIMDGVSFELQPFNGKLVLKSIRAIKPRSGAGSKFMKTLCDLADAEGVEINLHPVPLGDISQNKLMDFYKKFRFSGTTSVMVREPVLKLSSKFKTIPI